MTLCRVLLLAHVVMSGMALPILNPFQLFGEMFMNVMHPPQGALLTSSGYSHVYSNGAPPHHPPLPVASITTSVQLTQTLGGEQTGNGFLTGNGHVYSQQSRPHVDRERHVLGQFEGHHEVASTTTESSSGVPSESSFSDYLRRATYDWMKKYKLAYFSRYYTTPGPSPPKQDPPLTTPMGKFTTTASTTTPTSSPGTTNSTLNTTESIENTTTAASSTTRLTSARPTTNSSTTLSSTTTSSTTTSSSSTTSSTSSTTSSTSSTTSSTSSTWPTIRSTTPTTIALRPITVLDQTVDDMTGGFLPDQPNLGTRWNHHHIEQTVDNLV